MTSSLYVDGEVTMTCENEQVIVRGRGKAVEIEVPGLLWTLRRFRELWALASVQTLHEVRCRAGVSFTFRTQRRRLITIRPQQTVGLPAWLGLPSCRLHLLR